MDPLVLASVITRLTTNSTDDLEFPQITSSSDLQTICDALKENKNISTVVIAQDQMVAFFCSLRNDCIKLCINGSITPEEANLTVVSDGYHPTFIPKENYLSGAKTLEMLYDVYKTNNRLVKLTIENEHMNVSSSTHLANIIRLNTVNCLTFDNCHVNEDAVDIITEAVKTNSSIIELYFELCIFGQWYRMFDSFRHNKSIGILYLRNCFIGQHGLNLLVDALKENTNVIVLVLVLHNITNEGFDSIADLLATSQSLMEVKIVCSDNATATIENYMKIANAVAKSKSIVQCECGVQTPASCRTIIDDACSRNYRMMREKDEGDAIITI